MGFFRKNRKVADGGSASPFVECRGWNGYAFHVRDVRDETGNTLCGIEPLDDASALTPESFARSMQNQHESFFYCSDCAVAYTRATAEVR